MKRVAMKMKSSRHSGNRFNDGHTDAPRRAGSHDRRRGVPRQHWPTQKVGKRDEDVPTLAGSLLPLAYALGVAVLLLGTACSDEPTGLPVGEPASLSVAEVFANPLPVGDRVPLTVEVHDGDGQVLGNVDMSFTSADPQVATVSPEGVVTAVGPGEADITVVAGATSHTIQLAVADPDYTVLVELYLQTRGPEWTNSVGWLESFDISSWYGVSTDSRGRVVALNLYDNELEGRIPPHLGDLDRLEVLDLARNDLGGEIPRELGNLGALEVLDIGENELSGHIPPEIGDLRRLTRLSLWANDLEGEIPAQIGQLRVLAELLLHQNGLYGKIPPELGRLGRLRALSLSRNDLDGEIPPELGKLEALSSLHLGENELSGSIPPEIGDLRNLRWLGLSHNQLSGEIPLLGGLQDLVGVELSHNELTGGLPEGFGSLRRLRHLLVGGNGIGGPLPMALRGLRLDVFGYRDTELCVPMDDQFRMWLDGIAVHSGTGVYCAPESDRGILEVLYHAMGGPGWDHRDNWLTDAPLDDWYGVETDDTTGRVTLLELNGNMLSGRIPPEMGSLRMLESLVLTHNFLEGEIPPELGNLGSLQYLDLGGNLLEGEIPPDLGNMSNLHTLLLPGGGVVNDLGYFNELVGEIPPELGDLNELKVLNLAANELVGEIPPELGDLKKLEALHLDGNGLSGEIPPELGDLQDLQHLWLAHNELVGEIPPELGNLHALRDLGLAHNSLEGALPLSLAALSSIERFHYGGNALCVPTDESFGAWLDGIADAYASDIFYCPTRLTNHPGIDQHPAWSPDGGRIVFASNRNGGQDDHDIFVMNADGSGVKPLLTLPGSSERYPSWSPDGARIAFTSNRDGDDDIFIMNADGTGVRRLTDDTATDWQPDFATGNIVFSSDRGGDGYVLYLAWLDDEGVTLWELEDERGNPIPGVHPTVSPDSQVIAFTSARLVDGTYNNFEIFSARERGDDGQLFITRLTHRRTVDRHPAWSPDGRRIAFTSNPDGSEHIFVMNADGTGVTRLTNHYRFARRPKWSSDGSTIVFESGRDGGHDLYIIPAPDQSSADPR